MNSRFDGSSVLAAIARHPGSFPALKTDIDTTARKLLLKQLKAASLNSEIFAKVLSAIGESGLRISLDGMEPKDLAALGRRLDPANASLSGMSTIELGNHLFALGRGELMPVPGRKAITRTPAKKQPKELSKIGEVLNSKVHSGEPIEPPKAPRARKRSSTN